MAAKAKSAEGEEGAEATPVKAGSSRKRLLMIVGAALLVCGLGGGGYYYMSHRHHAEAAAAEPPPKPVAFFDLPDVLVNLAGTNQERTQYLKVKITLELPDPMVLEKIKPVMPRVLDTFQVFLRELRPTDLDGSAGLFRLKEELTRRVNMAIAPSHINAVLFKEIVVQ